MQRARNCERGMPASIRHGDRIFSRETPVPRSPGSAKTEDERRRLLEMKNNVLFAVLDKPILTLPTSCVRLLGSPRRRGCLTKVGRFPARSPSAITERDKKSFPRTSRSSRIVVDASEREESPGDTRAAENFLGALSRNPRVYYDDLYTSTDEREQVGQEWRRKKSVGWKGRGEGEKRIGTPCRTVGESFGGRSAIELSPSGLLSL